MNNTYADTGNQTLLTSDTSSTGQDQLRYDSRGVAEVTHTEPGSQTSRFYVERDPQGNIVALRTPSGTEYYPLTDKQGSILDIVNTVGVAVDTYYYNAYGVQTVVTNTMVQPFGYLGACTNSGTGLIHLGARYYDPTNVAFTQPDPQDHNTDVLQNDPYSYAGGDPINNTDTAGRDAGQVAGALTTAFSFEAGGELIGAASGVAAGVGLAAGIVTGGIGLAIVGGGIALGDFFSSL